MYTRDLCSRIKLVCCRSLLLNINIAVYGACVIHLIKLLHKVHCCFWSYFIYCNIYPKWCSISICCSISIWTFAKFVNFRFYFYTNSVAAKIHLLAVFVGEYAESLANRDIVSSRVWRLHKAHFTLRIHY